MANSYSKLESGVPDSRRFSILYMRVMTPLVMALFLGPVASRAADIKINSDALTITGDDGNPNSINGVPFRALVEDGVARFYIAGDLTIGNNDTVTVTGGFPASLVVGGDLTINPNAVIDVSAVGLTPGPGGGASGDGGDGGPGGLGGRGSYGGYGGSGGLGGSDNFDPTKVRDGEDGEDGDSPPNASPGKPGETGSTGGVGGEGFNSPAGGGVGGDPGTGGQGGTAGDGNPLGGSGGGGGPFGGVYEFAVGDVNGDPGGNPSQGGANGNDAPILSPEVGLAGSGGMNTGSGETLSGGSGGGAGGGGGGGGGGGAGEGGAGGGGGGGGGLLLPLVGGTGGHGGYGGAGGFGGPGGNGGVGGRGGAGGGAIEIVVHGTLTWTGEIRARGGTGESVQNNGDDGGPGRPGSEGGNGSAGQHNTLDIQNYVNGGRGGKGSSGGQGGVGAKGADGGGGGGGAGGTVKVMASVLGPTAGAVTDTRGGAGTSVTPNNDGGQGRFLFGNNINGVFAGSVQGGPLDGVTGPMAANPHLVADEPSPTIDNLTDGPEAYGLTDLTAASFPSVVSNAPAGAVAALVRLDVGPSPLDADYANYDMVFLINLSGTTLQAPRMGIGFESLARLRRGSYGRDLRFGGPGIEVLDSIGPDQVYATLAPEGSADFNLAAMAGGVLRVASQQTLATGTGLYLTNTSPLLHDGIIHVQTTGSNPTTPFEGGDQWANSLSNLQRAMNRAANGDGLYPEVWVAQGSYAPAGPGTSDRQVSFRLVNGVAVYGGFAGTESTRDGRNPALRPTIMSGDLNGDDVPSFTNNTENVYHVVEAIGVDETAVLDGFVIRSGNANEPGGNEGIPADVYNRGAGLYVDNGSPTIVDCTFIYNFASDEGGGIFVLTGAPTFTGCRLRINQASNRGSGAFLADGDSRWTDCIVTQNEPAALGGGLAVLSGSPSFTNCQVTQHVDVISGGGIVILGGTPLFRDCTISGNTVSLDAGGVFVAVDGSPTFVNCSITGNTAGARGGGLLIDSLTEDAHVFVTNGTIESNQAASGAGVLMESTAIRLEGVTIQSNTATGNGGGVLMEEGGAGGPTEIVNCAVQQNSAGGTGGGLHVNGGATYQMSGTTLTQNTATGDGGGISNNGDATLTACTVSNNTSSGNGGGIYTDNSTLTLVDSTIASNSTDSSGQDGGGIYSGANSTLQVSGGTIRGNQAANGWGGGLQSNGADTALDSVTLQDNVAGNGSGGAIAQEQGPLTLTDCRLVGNQASLNGGGLAKTSNGETNIDNSLFLANQTQARGAGIWFSAAGTADIRNSRFLGNTTDPSAGYGGGILWNGTGTVVNCAFSGNDSVDGSGIRAEGGELNLLNSTFAGNVAREKNSAFHSSSGTHTITNCIARGGPTAPIAGAGLTVSYSNVEGGFTGTGNIDQDPQFVDADGTDNTPGTEDDNLRLMPSSPCVDAGINAPLFDVAANDLDFNLRRADVAAVADTGEGLMPIVDMGAYEVYGTAIMPTMLVDGSAAEGTPGVSPDLQAVLTAAATRGGEVIEQIWVTEGTYRPTVPSGDREVAFNIPSGVEIYGGFPTGATRFEDRDPAQHPTILSADLNGDDESGGSNAENSYHVATAILCDETTLLDGFIFQGGNADGPSIPVGNNEDRSRQYGGGILIDSSSLVINDCAIQFNHAQNGGGVYNYRNRAVTPCCPEVMPVYMNCRFVGNTVVFDGGGSFDGENSHAYYEDCTFEANTADRFGGGSTCSAGGILPVFKSCTWVENMAQGGAGVNLDTGAAQIHDSVIRNNFASDVGGGYNATGSGMLMTNTLIVGNEAMFRGGGLRNQDSNLRALHCTIVGNTAPSYPALNLTNLGARVDFVNSIFWENRDSDNPDEVVVPIFQNSMLYKNCIIQIPAAYDPEAGGTLDLNPQFYRNTIGSDPLFRNMLGPDGLHGTGDEDLRLQSGSPALDSGTTDLSDLASAGVYTTVLPDFDFLGVPRISGPLPDCGAYEAQPGIVVTPLSGLDFGEISITGGNSVPLGVTIQNTGFGNLAFTEGSLSITGPDPEEFHFAGTPDTGPLAQDESRVFQLQFNPSTVGLRNAFLEINTDDPANPFIQVPLQGEGALTGLTGVTTRQIREFLLGKTTDPTNLDVNGDGTIDIGDVIRNEISIFNGGF